MIKILPLRKSQRLLLLITTNSSVLIIMMTTIIIILSFVLMRHCIGVNKRHRERERERESGRVLEDYEIGEDGTIVSVRTHASNFNFPDD